MTNKEIHNMKYKVCCPLCDNDKCVRGTDKCEAEIWAKQRENDSGIIDEEAISILKKAIDNISKALDEFYEELPQYLRTELLHPKKKPRGSMRRIRQGR